MVQFSLDKRSPAPIYRQIMDMILAGISTGTILPGEKLPTIRELAVDLAVNPNTIVKAYSQLQMMGVLDTQQGSGVYVRALGLRRNEAEHRRVLEMLCRDFVGRGQLLGLTVDQIIDELRAMSAGSVAP